MESRRTVEGITYKRIPIKTKVLTPEDDIVDLVVNYTAKLVKSGDMVVISESPVAMTQGRAIFEKDIKVGFLANLLWRGVSNVSYGVGLRSPSSMQCAVDEVGKFRIVCAAFIGFIGKIFGQKGLFYRIAGKQAALIDAAHTCVIPPYDKTVIKGPVNTDMICQKIKASLGVEAAIMDINDIGGSWVIASTEGINKDLLELIMNDNPQGQTDAQTPICLVRKQ